MSPSISIDQSCPAFCGAVSFPHTAKQKGDIMSNSEENIKKAILHLYEKAPNIHVRIRQSRSKQGTTELPAIIKGVYSHIFLVEENSTGITERHSLQYADILTGRIVITELTEKVGD